MSSEQNKKKLFGMITSFLNSTLSIFVSLFFVPFLIRSLGNNDYGVYQIVAAFAANLSVLNFGMSTIMSRNIVRFRYKEDSVSLDNTLFLGGIASVVLFIVVCCFGSLIGLLLPGLYGKELTPENFSLLEKMYQILIVYMGGMVIESYLSGIIIGYEQFSVNYLIRIASQIFRMLLIIVFIQCGLSVIFVSLADLAMIAVHILADFLYVKCRLGFHMKWHFWDKALLRVMLSFAVASSLHSIITQVNVSLDKLILGKFMLPSDVAIYSVALQLMTAIITITKIFSSVYLPDATKLITDNAPPRKLEELVEFPGKLQSGVAFGASFAFLVLGKELLRFWVGEEFQVMWGPALMMLFPLSLAYSTTVADLILDAKLKRLARTLILFFTAIVNLVLTILLVPKYGYYGAAFGTGFSYIVGNVVLLNVYYRFELKINILRVYYKILRGVLAASAAAMLPVFLIKRVLQNVSLTWFFALAILYSVIYLVVFLLLSFSKEERRKVIKRLVKKKK